ncbi:MAG: molybdenum cofactor biosynthesis protein MoaE [Acidimicrobiales bacterium]
MVEPPSQFDERDWIGVTEGVLRAEPALTWASRPGCGAVVSFCGTVRDHSEGRPGVTALEYEVHPEQAVPRLSNVAESARGRWPMVGRLVLLHRVGLLAVGEISVLVVVSTPHRSEAFAAAEYCIDTLKRSVPIWKRETWAGGTDWSACVHDIEDIGA